MTAPTVPTRNGAGHGDGQAVRAAALVALQDAKGWPGTPRARAKRRRSDGVAPGDPALSLTATLSPAAASTAGVVTNYANTIDGPGGITTGPDGAMWFTNYGNRSIGRITTKVSS